MSPAETRRGLAVLCCCLTCVGLGQAVVFATLPPVARELGLSPFLVSLIFATSAVFWVVMSPVWGRRSDVVGRRPIILTGLLGFAASMLLLPATIEAGLRGWLSLSFAYPLMIAARCIFGFFGAGAMPASQAYVADRTTRDERARGIALIASAFGIGQSLGPAVAGVLSFVGVLAPFYFTAAAATLSAASLWYLLPEDQKPDSPAVDSSKRLRFYDRRIRPFLWIAAAMQAVRSTTAITLAFFLQDSLSLSAEQTVRYASLGFVAMALAGVVAQLLLVQRIPMTALQMMRGGLAVGVVALLCLVLGSSMAAFTSGLVLLGLALGTVRPGNSAGASLAVGADEQGAAAGVLNSIGVIGNIVGPLLGSAIYEIRPVAPYAMNALIMAAALVFALSARSLRRLH